ncbi:MAG: cobalamin biosynthesis protein [Ferruginibacter sp.]|nr:cobalamin biosynthesis protein [Rhodoferax sp.]
MSVAGLGFRAQCSVASLRAALDAALQTPTPTLPRSVREQDSAPALPPPSLGEGWGGGEQPTTTYGYANLTALATAADKAHHPALLQLAAELQLPIIPIPLPLLASQAATPSVHVPARYGARSVSEAAALAAAGPGATLASARCASPDRLATAAIATPGNTPK